MPMFCSGFSMQNLKKMCVDKWQENMCWERGLFFLAESTLGLFWKVQGASWETLLTNGWSNVPPIWLSPVLGSVQAFLGCECLCYSGVSKNQTLPWLWVSDSIQEGVGEQDHTGAAKKTAVELERGHLPGGHWLGLGVSFAGGHRLDSWWGN